jgi:hypothetical protein
MSSPDEENGTAAATATAMATPITATDASAALLCERGIIRSDLGTKPVMIKCGEAI